MLCPVRISSYPGEHFKDFFFFFCQKVYCVEINSYVSLEICVVRVVFYLSFFSFMNAEILVRNSDIVLILVVVTDKYFML